MIIIFDGHARSREISHFETIIDIRYWTHTIRTNLSIKSIPEGSHWVIHEQPQTVIDFMREFLATG
jgi:pimeloyl-ACP methyl ester carboxylesterase